jgi:hypothetical protein
MLTIAEENHTLPISRECSDGKVVHFIPLHQTLKALVKRKSVWKNLVTIPVCPRDSNGDELFKSRMVHAVAPCPMVTTQEKIDVFSGEIYPSRHSDFPYAYIRSFSSNANDPAKFFAHCYPATLSGDRSYYEVGDRCSLIEVSFVILYMCI